MVRTILLGGYGQKLKVLQKYSMENRKFQFLPNNSLWGILTPNYGHVSAMKQLDKLLSETNDNVVIHSISTSSWYLMTYLQNKHINFQNIRKIRGVILESNPYLFRIDRLVNVAQQNSYVL